jgi:hypothetical protein
MANINFKLDKAGIDAVMAGAEKALFKTAEALHTEVVQAQVMPFDTGHMQNESTSVQKITNEYYELQTVTPYAARLYYHPEYNFNKASNPNAQGRWLEPWINGAEKDFCEKAFAKFMKEELK